MMHGHTNIKLLLLHTYTEKYKWTIFLQRLWFLIFRWRNTIHIISETN